MRNTKYKTFVPAKKPATLREKVFGVMLLVVIAIMPIIVRFTVVYAAPELVALLGQVRYPDFFSVYKGWALGIPVVVMAFYTVSDWVIGGVTKDRFLASIKSPPIAAACLFLFMALLSTIFSSYRHTSWFGTAERNEGMFTLLGYFIVFFAAMHYVKAAKHAKLLMYGLAFSSIIMGLIGLSQFIGRDFFATTFGMWLVMGEWGATMDHRFTIAHGTLYNPNTFGIYTAMTAPILLACALAYDGRGWIRAIFLAGGVLMLIGVIGSGSVGGLIGIVTAVMVAAITLACRFIYQMRLRQKEEMEGGELAKERNTSTITWLIGAAVLMALLIGLFFVPTINQRLNFLLERVQHAVRREVVPTYSYTVDGNRFIVRWQDTEKFTLVLLEEPYGPDNLRWHIYDASGQPIPVINRTASTAPAGESPPPWRAEFTYDIPGHSQLIIQCWEGYWEDYDFFTVHGLAIFLYDGRIHAHLLNATKTDLTIPIPAIGFEGNETWGSNRGHIWSRSFPLMARRTIIGSGPDTYVLVFPQHDVLGKLQFHRNPYTTIGMAHNVYLQTWITTGGISALALIFLFGYYLLTSFISIVRSRMKEGMFIFGLRFGLLAGISAFCMSAMATDSTIGSSGVFYLLLGLGFGVNFIVDMVEL